jgi:hypothetical protein
MLAPSYPRQVIFAPSYPRQVILAPSSAPSYPRQVIRAKLSGAKISVCASVHILETVYTEGYHLSKSPLLYLHNFFDILIISAKIWIEEVFILERSTVEIVFDYVIMISHKKRIGRMVNFLGVSENLAKFDRIFKITLDHKEIGPDVNHYPSSMMSKKC